jgi:hypothetical protein
MIRRRSPFYLETAASTTQNQIPVQNRVGQFANSEVSTMNVSHEKSSRNFLFDCASVLERATRELAAFCGAVAKSFGMEQARLSAEDWLDALAGSERLPSSTREWRAITVKAAARLATRTQSLTVAN